MKTAITLGCICLLATAGHGMDVDEKASDQGDWAVEKQHKEAVVKEGTPVRVFNHYGDVRVRRMKDDRIAAFAIVQTPPGGEAIAPLLLINAETGMVTVGNPTDELLAEDLMTGTGDVVRVDLTVFVPDESRVSVETQNGFIQVSGVHKPVSVRTISGAVRLAVSSDVDVQTRDGDVDLLLKTCNRGQGVSVETVTGSVTLRFPRPADARLRVQTGGELQTDFSVSIQQRVTSATKIIRARICEGVQGPRGFFGRLLKQVTSPVGLVARVNVTSSRGDVELYRAAPEWRGAVQERRQ